MHTSVVKTQENEIMTPQPEKMTSQDYVSPLALKSEHISEFDKFSSLPPELRIAIWKHARPTPRYIKLSCRTCQSRPESEPAFNCTFCHELYSRAPPPALLHVNRESRAIALKWYTLSFGWVVLGPRKTTYFDWDRDGFLWDDDRDRVGNVNLNQLNEMNAAKIKHLLICGLDTKYNGGHAVDKATMLAWFKGLESNVEVRLRPRGIDRGFIEFDDQDINPKNFRVRTILLLMDIRWLIWMLLIEFVAPLRYLLKFFCVVLVLGILTALLMELNKRLWNEWL